MDRTFSDRAPITVALNWFAVRRVIQPMGMRVLCADKIYDINGLDCLLRFALAWTSIPELNGFILIARLRIDRRELLSIDSVTMQ